jgi:hypothetical protein
MSSTVIANTSTPLREALEGTTKPMLEGGARAKTSNPVAELSLAASKTRLGAGLTSYMAGIKALDAQSNPQHMGAIAGCTIVKLVVSPACSLRGKLLSGLNLPAQSQVMSVVRENELQLELDSLFLCSGDVITVETLNEEKIRWFFMF